MADANQAAINDGPWNDPPPEDGPWNDPPPAALPEVPMPAGIAQPVRKPEQDDSQLTSEQRFLKNTSVGRILDSIGQGAKAGWGDDPIGLDPDSEKWFRDHGIFNDLNSTWKSPFKTFNEGFIRTAAAQLDLAFKALAAPTFGAIGGLAQAGAEFAPGVYDRDSAKDEWARTIYATIQAIPGTDFFGIPVRFAKAVAGEEAAAGAKKYIEELAKRTEDAKQLGPVMDPPSIAVFDLNKIDEVLQEGEGHADYAALQNLIHNHADSSTDIAGRLLTPDQVKKNLMAKGVAEDRANEIISPFVDTKFGDPFEEGVASDHKVLSAKEEAAKENNALAKEVGKHAEEEEQKEIIKDDFAEGALAILEGEGGEGSLDFEKMKAVAEGGGTSADFTAMRRILGAVDVTAPDAPMVLANPALLKEKLIGAGYDEATANSSIAAFVKDETAPTATAQKDLDKLLNEQAIRSQTLNRKSLLAQYAADNNITVDEAKVRLNAESKDAHARINALEDQLKTAPNVEARPAEVPEPTAASTIRPMPGSHDRPVEKELPALPTPEEIGTPQVPATVKPAALPAPQEYVDRAGNISLDLINGPEDIKDVVRETANWSVITNGEPRPFDAARRGVIPYAQSKEMADALGMTPEEFGKLKIGSALNAEEMQGAIMLLRQTSKAVRDLSLKAAGGDEQALLDYETAVLRHQMVQEHFAGVSAEAGRALNVLRMAQAEVKALRLNDLSDAVGSVSTKQDVLSSAKRVAKMDDEQKISKFLWDARKAKTADMITEYWINSILSGPRTHFVNMMSNTLTALWSIPETGLAAGIGRAREFISGIKDTDKVAWREAQARFFGLMQGVPEGLQAAKDTFVTEIPYGGISKFTGEQRKATGSIPGLAGRVIRVPTRALMGEDAFFKALGYRSELWAQAYRQAAKEGLKGEAFKNRVAELIQNPSKAVMNAAWANADYLTFQSELGKLGKAIQRFSNVHPFAKFVVTFVRTPANILKWANERQPFGRFLSQKIKDNLNGVNGTIAKDTQYARLVMGTAVAMGFMGLAAEGLFTGTFPLDPNKKALLYLSGMQPCSLKIGDKWVPMSRVDPMSTLICVAADTYRLKDQLTEGQFAQVAAGMVTSISQNILNKTWTKSVSDLFEMLKNPEENGAQYMKNMAASFVPNLFNQVARVQDPYLRDTRKFLDGMIYRVPFWSDVVVPKIDIWGDPIKLSGKDQDSELKAFGNIRDAIMKVDPVDGTLLTGMMQGWQHIEPYISPFYSSKVTNDPATIELVRLSVFPGQPKAEINGVPLTEKQTVLYKTIAGKLAHQTINNLVTQPWWQAIPDGKKEKIIRNTFDHAREVARFYTMLQYKELYAGAIQNRLNEMKGGPVTGAGSYYYQMLNMNK